MAHAQSNSNGAYVLLEDKDKPALRSSRLQCLLAVFLTAALGLSTHTSKNALAPAEPSLEAHGLSPMLYSVIYALTTLCGILLPMAWGFAYVKCQLFAIIAVPLGIFLGQVAVAVGTAMDDSFISSQLLVFGWLLVCICRAGGEVVQHISLVQCMPTALTSGFVILIFFTHLTYVSCNLLVPRILSAGGSSFLNVQLVLLFPGLISVVAAFILAYIRYAARQKDGDDSVHQQEAPFMCKICTHSFMWSEWAPKACRWIILWNGLAVGILHAFQSVTNAMSASFGLSIIAAGNLNAWNQLTSLIVLPLAGIFGDACSRFNETLIVVLSVASLFSGCTLMLKTIIVIPAVAWQCALLVLQVVGVLAPVVSLALVPKYTSRTGEAFGVVDTLKNISQCVFVLLIGTLRQESGGKFETSAIAICIGFGAMTIAAGIFYWEARRPTAEKDERWRDVVAVGMQYIDC